MLTAVSIKNLRGIREGELRDLTPLVVLVGPNGSGKSTILEAVEIGASQQPALGARNALVRRDGNAFALQWLFWKMGRNGPVEVRLDTEAGVSRIVSLTLKTDSTIHLSEKRHAPDGISGEFFAGDVTSSGPGTFSFSTTNRPFFSDFSDQLFVSPFVRDTPPLDELFSALVRQGRRDEALSLLGNLVPGLQQLDVLTEKGRPVLYLTFADRAVPATLAGDGIHLLLRLGFQLATVPGGVALLEEPETHLHPGAILQCARAIVAAVRRNVQVILTTHSLELIDSILSQLSTPEEQNLLSVYGLRLDDGMVKSSRLSGPEVAFARNTIMDDLR